jgi:hypothetical protein
VDCKQFKNVHYAELCLNANKMHILEAKLGCVGSSPTTGTNFISLFFNKMVRPEEGSASESASEINTGVKLNHHPGIKYRCSPNGGRPG